MTVNDSFIPNAAAKKSGSLLIVDSKKLRQAGIIRLLESWAECLGLVVVGLSQNEPPEQYSIGANCEMIILSVGNTSVEHPTNLKWIKNVRTNFPNAPIVLLSDRDEPAEVYAALRNGATAFLPTDTELSDAVHVLSFIRSGGQFFPVSALRQAYAAPAGSSTTIAAANGANGCFKGSITASQNLTPKQEQVIALLRQGDTNKMIARELGMSEATVKVHVRLIMRKLGAKNRTQIALSSVHEHHH